MRLLFVRHAEPDYSIDALTPLGHRQAAAAAERLANEGITHIVSSTCGRAWLTAEYTAKRLGLPIEPADFMREIGWGSRDGSEIMHNGNPWNIGGEAIAAGVSLMCDPEKEPFFNNNRVLDSVVALSEGLDNWLAGRGYHRDGEYYKIDEDADNSTVAIFCHNGATAAALSHLTNIPFFYLCSSVSINHASITAASLPKVASRVTGVGLSYINDFRHTLGV